MNRLQLVNTLNIFNDVNYVKNNYYLKLYYCQLHSVGTKYVLSYYFIATIFMRSRY